MSSTIGPARPASLRRSVTSIETMTPSFGAAAILSVVGGTNRAVGEAHGARLGIARRSPRLLLPGLARVFGARLALRLKPFERRPRLGGARLNITRRTLARG